MLHDDEIPIDAVLVRALVDRTMPHHADLPVRRLDSSGSTNALFRLGEDLLVRLPRQPGGSAAIAKEARWHGRLAAVLDFGALSVGDPAVDLVVAWEVLDPPSREIFRRKLGVDDATWLRGRAWALSLTFMIWYYWATMPRRRARSIAVGRNVLADAGHLG